MQFIKASGWQPAVAALSERLQHELGKGKKVLWLVPGGSNIPASVAVMDSLSEKATEQLAVLLTDERYGVPGHKDSNFKRLHDTGFSPRQAMFTPALIEGLNLQEAVHRYEELVERALSNADA